MEATDGQYREALGYIQGLTDYEHIAGAGLSSASFDLRRTEGLLRRLGMPQQRFPSIIVAGTKGKGSTAAMISAIMRAAGLRAGLYSQPHLHTYRERIRVDDTIIGKEQLAAQTWRVKRAVDSLQRAEPALGLPTTYEVGTALALQHFAGEGVQVAVLEVGLGGRLDAVNVVTPVVAVITAISLDHMAVLGNSIREIAREKAGIIKPGGRVVVAPQRDEALLEIAATCREREGVLFLVQEKYRWSSVRGDSATGVGLTGQMMDLEGPCGTYRELFVPLLGDHQLANAATAVAVCEVLRGDGWPLGERQMREGIANTRWPGRFERIGENPPVVLDGAHNRDSAEHLVATLRETFPGRRIALIVGTSVDKDIAGIAAPLADAATSVWVTRSRHPRAAAAPVIVEAFARHGIEANVAANVAEALQEARDAAGPNDVICVTGSLFVVAEGREALGLVEEAD